MLKVEDDGPGAMQRHYGDCKDKAEAAGGVMRYTRTFVLKQLSMSVERANELKGCYRTISGNERNTVVLRAMPK
jgi:hypothetical protein